MKVLYIISDFQIGGRERQLYELLKGLKGKVETKLIILRKNFSYGIQDIGVEIKTINAGDWKNPAVHFELTRYILAFKPDIIHYWDYMSFFFAMEARLWRKMFLIDGSIRYAGKEKRALYTRLMKKISYAFANKIIANSHAGLKVEGLLGNTKAHVIHNGIDIKRFDRNPDYVIMEKNWNPDYISIVMAAGIKPAKDFRTLMQAAEVLCRSYDNIQFIIIGDGEDRHGLEDSLSAEVKDRILFLGMRNDVEQLLIRSDIGVLLSSNTEGLSNSIMEYMAAGLPVVATRRGGTPELVIEGETGFLVDNFSKDQVVDCLTILIKDCELREKNGNSGKELIKSNFTIEIMVKNQLELYSKLLHKEQNKQIRR